MNTSLPGLARKALHKLHLTLGDELGEPATPRFEAWALVNQSPAHGYCEWIIFARQLDRADAIWTCSSGVGDGSVWELETLPKARLMWEHIVDGGWERIEAHL